MTFVDSNVFVYAVGRRHPLRTPARELLRGALAESLPLVTSAEVLQELLHIYRPTDRTVALEAAWTLALSVTVDVWSVELDDLELARIQWNSHPELSARDLLHLACCRRRGVERIHTFDRALKVAVEG